MDQLEKAVRVRLESYLTGATSLDERKEWLVGVTSNIEGKASREAVDPAYAVELALTEASRGI